MEGGGFAAARPSIVRKENGGALAVLLEIKATCPLIYTTIYTQIYKLPALSGWKVAMYTATVVYVLCVTQTLMQFRWHAGNQWWHRLCLAGNHRNDFPQNEIHTFKIQWSETQTTWPDQDKVHPRRGYRIRWNLFFSFSYHVLHQMEKCR